MQAARLPGPASYPYGFYFNLNGQSALAALYNGSNTSLTGWFTSTVSKGDVFAIRVHNGSLTFVYNGTVKYTYRHLIGFDRLLRLLYELGFHVRHRYLHAKPVMHDMPRSKMANAAPLKRYTTETMAARSKLDRGRHQRVK